MHMIRALHFPACFPFVFCVGVFMLCVITNDSVGQEIEPGLTRAQKRLLIQQRQFFASGFKSIEALVRNAGADREMQQFYREAALIYQNLRKPVPVGLPFLRTNGDWTHLVNVVLEPIESLGDGIYHVKIGNDHVALNFDGWMSSKQLSMEKSYLMPFIIIRLDKTNFTQTNSGKPVHYAVPMPAWEIPDGYLEQERFRKFGQMNMLMIGKDK